jgi:hypothetical protein
MSNQEVTWTPIPVTPEYINMIKSQISLISKPNTSDLDIYSITPVSNYWIVEHSEGQTKIGGRELRQHIIAAGLNEHYEPTTDCQDMELIVDDMETWIADEANLGRAVESFLEELV